MNFFTDYQTTSQGQAASSTQGLQFSQYCQNIDPPADETMEMEQDAGIGGPITGLEKYIDMDDDKVTSRFKVSSMRLFQLLLNTIVKGFLPITPH